METKTLEMCVKFAAEHPLPRGGVKMNADITFEEYCENPHNRTVALGVRDGYDVRARIDPYEGGVDFVFTDVNDYTDRRHQWMQCAGPKDFLNGVRVLLGEKCEGASSNWYNWEDGNGNSICVDNAIPEEE